MLSGTMMQLKKMASSRHEAPSCPSDEMADQSSFVVVGMLLNARAAYSSRMDGDAAHGFH